MLLNLAELLWSEEGLNGPVLVDWGNVTGVRPDLVAAAGNRIYIFSPGDNRYFLSASSETAAEVLSLAVGLPFPDAANIVLGLEDRLAVYGVRQGALVRFWESEPDPGARFVDLILGDLDGDGRDEVIAASAGRDSLFIYRLSEDMPEPRLELLAIRILPGPAQRVAVLKRKEGEVPVLAAAYASGETSGLLTLIFTEMGFADGPALEPLPARVSSLAAGDLRAGPEEELAWGGTDGSVRVVELDRQLTTVLTTDNLGSDVPALTAGTLAWEAFTTLLAGTPEAFLFGFGAPVEQPSPDWALPVGRPVNDLSVSEEGLLGLGSSDGGVQVWLLSTVGRLYHVVRPGETLSDIAELYGTTAASIIEINRLLDPDLIMSGLILLIS